MNAEEVKAARAKLLAAAAGGTEQVSRLLTYDGADYEVRQMNIKDRKRLMDRAEKEKLDFNVLAAIHCTFVPNTQVRVFDEADASHVLMLENTGSGGLADSLSETIGQLAKDAREKGKSSPSGQKT